MKSYILTACLFLPAFQAFGMTEILHLNGIQAIEIVKTQERTNALMSELLKKGADIIPGRDELVGTDKTGEKIITLLRNNLEEEEAPARETIIRVWDAKTGSLLITFTFELEIDGILERVL